MAEHGLQSRGMPADDSPTHEMPASDAPADDVRANDAPANDLVPPDRLIRLDGRVIVVTGAGGGIGGGIARRLIAAGACVVAHTRSSPVDQLFGADGVPTASVQADLTAHDGPQRVIDAAIAQHGRVDGLVNNAAVQPLVHFRELSDDDWSEMIEVNLTAAHRLTQCAAAAMRCVGTGGSIVHIASIEGHQPTDLHGHYAVAKAGLLMHARAAAGALGREGIRVNAVSPGLIDRPGLAADWPQGVARWRAAAPLGRLGTAADIGDACVFLCSDLARWITGIDLVVDGGVLTRPTW
ncbi:SDR family NAD(P)-dependent oxidoreductase [Candidatus Poriferisodalis sp.]|uniref:SDR family NAD(P)-dependent oxidoreductase n=1 Tax=Candidatus Poriferisodalis sp. TaxID=3101277 RepID=UPI003B010798